MPYNRAVTISSTSKYSGLNAFTVRILIKDHTGLIKRKYNIEYFWNFSSARS